MKNSTPSQGFNMKWKFTLIMSALMAVCLLPGCVDFKNQILTYQYNKEADTLRIFQNYKGIITTESKAGGEAGGQISDKDKNQLDSVINGQRTFFFSNWITEYNQKNFKELRTKLKTPEGREQENLSSEGLATMEKVVDVLLENVQVENGPFYFDSNQQVSAVQYVTITNCSVLMTAINDFAPYFLKEEISDESSEAEMALLNNFIKSSQSMVQFEGSALTIRWPCSSADFDHDFGNESADSKMIAEMKRAGLKASFANDVVTLRFGDPDRSINRLSVKVSDKPYNTYLADFVGGQYTIDENLDVSMLEREFLQNGERKLLSKKK